MDAVEKIYLGLTGSEQADTLRVPHGVTLTDNVDIEKIKLGLTGSAGAHTEVGPFLTTRSATRLRMVFVKTTLPRFFPEGASRSVVKADPD